jgi:HSP20 family protein
MIMVKKDRSFFGKIMGGNITDEEEDHQTVQQSAQIPVSQQGYDESEAEVEELVEEEYDDEDVTDVEVEEDEQVMPQKIQTINTTEQQPVKEKRDEEWLSDYEGQLNIDMYQTKDNVIIKSTIAGVRAEDIDITVANDMVSIKGTRRKEENVPQQDYFYQECYWGNFTRSVIVPVDIDSENIEADLKDGMLTVIVPKAAKAKTKKIRVKGL